MKAIGIILGVVVAGLVLYIVWGLFGGGVANAAGTDDTLRRTSGVNAKPPQGFNGAYGPTKYVGFDAMKGRMMTDKGTFFNQSTPKTELKEAKGFGLSKGLSGLFAGGHIGQR